jgi:hypothetical protein
VKFSDLLAKLFGTVDSATNVLGGLVYFIGLGLTAVLPDPDYKASIAQVASGTAFILFTAGKKFLLK